MNLAFSRPLTITIVAALALFAAACSSDSSPDEAAAEAPITEETADTTDATDLGETEPNSTDEDGNDFTPQDLDGALVDSFPDDVPLYDGEIESSLSNVGEVTGLPEWSVTMFTNDSFDMVDAAIREAFSSNGWEISSEMEYGGGPMLVTRHASYTVTVAYNDAYTENIMIVYGVSAVG